MNANVNPELSKDRMFSVVGEMLAEMLAYGSATIAMVETHTACVCAQAVKVSTPQGTARLYMVDGRYYDRCGTPLASFDSATVERFVDALLGHRDSPDATRLGDRLSSGPVRGFAIQELWELATN